MHSVKPVECIILTLEIAESSWWIIIIIIICVCVCVCVCVGTGFIHFIFQFSPPNKSHNVLVQGNVGANDHA